MLILKTKKKIIYSGILVLLIMAMIFFFSAQNANESSLLSGRFVSLFIKFFVKNYDLMDPTRQLAFKNLLSSVLRECAHCAEFGILGISLMLHLKNFKKKFAYVFLIGAVYSVSDEIHQIFVPGRTCQFMDVMIDCIGLFLGIGFVYITVKLFDIK